MIYVQNGFVKMDCISIRHENLAIIGSSKVCALHMGIAGRTVLYLAGQRGDFQMLS